MRRLAAVLLLALGLTACSLPPPPSFPPLTFNKQAPIFLDVASIKVVMPQVSGGPGHIENRFDVPPASAVKAWVQDRLNAAGSVGKAVVTIEDASVVEKQDRVTRSMLGLMTEGGEWHLAGRIVAHIDASQADTAGSQSANARVDVRRTRTLARDVTAIERRQAYYNMTRDLMAGFNKDFTAAIRKHLGTFLR